MITDSAALIMFAIRSAVKLGHQARTAYVDSTRRRELVLPLPNFVIQTDVLASVEFFVHGSGKKFVNGYESFSEMIPGDDDLKQALSLWDQNRPDAALNRKLVDYHNKYRAILRVEAEGPVSDSPETPGAALALLSVQQWRRGYDPTPSTLHRMGGTLLEIGVDYALSSPDLFDGKSAKGKALKGFFEALDEIDFKEVELSELPARFLVSAIEAVHENPALVSGDAKVQELIKVTTKGLSSNALARLEEINGRASWNAIQKREARLDVEEWSELIFRTTLSTGGRLVLENPGQYLGLKDSGQEPLVSSVGSSLLDMVLEDRQSLRDLVSRQGLETLLKSALSAVGEHPEIVTQTGNNGLKLLIAGLAKDLSATENLLSKDILPEVVRMTLENTGENFDLFWPDLKNRPEYNLLATAAKTTLRILSAPPTSGKWRLQFGKSELLSVTETVLDQFVESPQWLLDEAGQLSGTLEEVLSGILGVLRKRADNRLTAPVAIEIVRASVQAVVLRQEFLDKLPNGQAVITAAVDAMMASIFKSNNAPQAAWQLLRSEVIAGATQVALEVLTRSDLEPKTIDLLKKALAAQVKVLKEGNLFELDVFERLLEERLLAA